jgi:hypothetical protein
MNTQDEATPGSSANTISQIWEPESPFLSDLPSGENASVSAAVAFGPQSELESPFTSEYALDGEVIPSYKAEQFARLIGELYDPEFEETLTDLVNEAAALAEDRLMHETGDSASERANLERDIREYLEPLEREAQAVLDRMIDAVGERDLSAMTEAEVDALFERYEPSAEMLSPVFEDFLKKFLKKAKSAVKAVTKIAGKVMPVNLVLGKLKSLVRPLLRRVLKFALKKLPPAVRPAAQQLAKRFLGISTGTEKRQDAKPDAEPDSDQVSQSAGDPAEIQEEFDTRFAGFMLAGEDFDRELEMMEFSESEGVEREDTLQELEYARSQFVNNIVSLAENQDPTPVVENYVQAVLAAARIAIKIIGRPKVINYLAGLVAKLIKKYVGKESALVLSRALVDTGLRLVSLEASPETERLAAGNTLASTIEDTMNRLAVTAPDETWENETLLEAYAIEAFEKAAAANFPDSDIKPELRETAEKSGAWVLMPVNGKHQRYKKYTRIIDVNLTPQMAQWVRSFGGVRLATILRDRYGITPGIASTVRLHLYEAIRGTTLSHIAFHEKGLAGLGQAGRSAWTLLHPLTPCGAGLLFQEPGLGSDIPDRFVANRNTISVGQRFYFVEVPSVTPRPLPRIQTRTGVSTGGRQSQTRLILHFPDNQIRLFIYYSDADAQNLKNTLQKKSLGAIPTLLTPGLDVSLRTIFSGNAPKQIQVVHEAVPTQQALPAAIPKIFQMIGGKICDLLIEWVLKAIRAKLEKEFDRFVEQFRRAADDPADGATLAIIFKGPSFFEKLRKFISGQQSVISSVLGLFSVRNIYGDVTVEIKPGFVYG